VDLIVVRDDHRIIAIEVKLSQSVGDEDVRHLRWLADKLGDDLLDAVVITTGSEAYRRADGIAVVPAGAFGP
jgi:predicted AAA+ superfamily ATPase